MEDDNSEGERPLVAMSAGLSLVGTNLKQITIPRLELLGVLIGIRKLNFVERGASFICNFKIPVDRFPVCTTLDADSKTFTNIYY